MGRLDRRAGPHGRGSNQTHYASVGTSDNTHMISTALFFVYIYRTVVFYNRYEHGLRRLELYVEQGEAALILYRHRHNALRILYYS